MPVAGSEVVTLRDMNPTYLVGGGKAGTPEFNELKRRFGFEYSGMRLHEFYFDNMKANGGAVPQGGKLASKLAEDFGSVENWEADFRATGMMRGIGWVVMYQDPHTGRLQNFFVGDHENGHPAGFTPVLVMDVWEHAFLRDYKASERSKYIEAFCKNIDWEAVHRRLVTPAGTATRPSGSEI